MSSSAGGKGSASKPADLNIATSEVLGYFSEILPLVYDFGEDHYVQDFKSLSGLACLCSDITLVNENKRHFLFKILGLVLSDERIVAKLTPADVTSATSLFCGSKILAAASQDHTSDFWGCSGLKYTKWLAKQLTQLSSIPPSMLDKLFKLGYPESAFEALLSLETWPKFLGSYKKLTDAAKRFILTAFLRTTPLNPPAIAAIWKHLEFGDLYSMLKLARQQSIEVQRAAVIWPEKPQLYTAAVQLLADWGSPVSISQFSIPFQTAQTQLIIGCASQLDGDRLLELTKTPEFSQGITAHLSSDSERSREMATVVGQVLARKAGQSLNFDIEYQHRYFFAQESIVDITEALAEQPEPMDIENMIDEFLVPEEPKLATAAASIGDSDDEDEEEIPTLVYVRDLILFLESSDYTKHHAAMSQGADLILRKARFGEEVRQYAPQLLQLLAGLTDKYNVNDFSTQRQRLLESVLVADPPMAEELCKILNGGDYSLYQRISMMNALVGAAKTLAEYTPKEFASEKMPALALHNAFYSPVDALTSSLQKLLVSGQDASDQINTKHNAFSRVAARYFFYPLASAVPKNYGSYTLLVYQHWVKTLGLLVFFSFPSNEMGDMVNQLLRIMLSARTTAHDAVYTCILLLCDVAPAILMQHFRQVSELCDWCGETWPQLQDPKQQQLGGSAHYRLSKLLQDLQQKFLSNQILFI